MKPGVAKLFRDHPVIAAMTSVITIIGCTSTIVTQTNNF